MKMFLSEKKILFEKIIKNLEKNKVSKQVQTSLLDELTIVFKTLNSLGEYDKITAYLPYYYNLHYEEKSYNSGTPDYYTKKEFKKLEIAFLINNVVFDFNIDNKLYDGNKLTHNNYTFFVKDIILMKEEFSNSEYYLRYELPGGKSNYISYSRNINDPKPLKEFHREITKDFYKLGKNARN